MVPNGWTLTSLGNLCEINPKKIKKPENGKVSFIAMNQLSEEGQLISHLPREYEEVSKGFTSFKDGDVLVAKITPCFENGKGALVHGLTNGVGFGSTEFHVLRAKENTSPEFIYYLTRTKELRVRGENNMQGSAGHRRVTADYFNAYKVLTPPLPEQRKIAKILSTWDKAISTTERLIDNSKQQKKALMQQLLTGAHTQRKRLLDDSGKPFEGEWEEVKLGDVVSTGRGFAFKSTQYSNSGYKIVRVTNIDSSGKIDLSDCVYIPAETACEYKKYELLENDILLVMVGATAGKLGYVSENTLPALLNQNMWSLRSKDSKRLCQIFLRHVIYQVIAKYLLSQQGSARGFFTQKTFESVKFSIPTLKEQQKIAAVLTNADQEIELLEQQLADLKQEKKALMQQLLTGKRRVNLS